MNCRSFAREVASGAERAGGSGSGFQFWLHWAVCRFCRRYWSELKLIAAAAAEKRPSPLNDPQAMKNRIRESVKRKMQ